MDMQARSVRLDRAPVTIDGHPLSDYGVFVTSDGWDIGTAKPRTSFTTIPGVDGAAVAHATTGVYESAFKRAYVDRREITIHVAAVGDPMQITETRLKLGRLVGRTVWFGGLAEAVDAGSVVGVASDEGAEFRGILSLDTWDTTRRYGGSIACAETIIHVDADPFLYGPQRYVPLPAGEATSIPVYGNQPVWPVFRFPRAAVGDDRTVTVTAGGLWKLTASGTAAPAVNLLMITESRSISSNWTYTLDSRFGMLPPGETPWTDMPTITASHAGQLEYRPLYLI